MGEWLYYNLLLKVFIRLYSIEIELYSKQNEKSLFSHPFGDLGGNVRTPYIGRWKARGDFLFVIIELFVASYA